MGSSSATPQFNRNHTSQYLQIGSNHILIDCGEGAQMQLRKFGIKFVNIDHIFISHLHGDHFFGLIGLLSSMHLNGRLEPLHIYAPYGLQEIITIQLKHSQSFLNFDVIFRETQAEKLEVLLENDNFTFSSFPLNHSIACTGFLLQEKAKKRRLNRKILPDKMLLQEIALLKKGEDVLFENGTIKYSNAEYTLDPLKNYSYAYCSDTVYDESLMQYIAGVDYLYHEATFLHEMLSRAETTFHTTCLQAGAMAKLANVGTLLIGHFSARYKELNPLLEEAKTVFENTILAYEGLVIEC